MKKSVFTIMLFFAGILLVAAQVNKPQEEPKKQTPNESEQAAKKAVENDFQAKKAQEAKDKQEAKRKAMKEKAKNKVEQEQSK